MRRRIPYRVCRCLPNGVVTHLEARLLKDLVNREIHPIRCAESCKRKFQKAMYLGDLCAETGHFWWARKIWRFAAGLIEDKDYDDWRNGMRIAIPPMQPTLESPWISRIRLVG